MSTKKKLRSPSALERKASRTSLLPENYVVVLAELKGRVRAAQVKAAISVNRELIALYLHIGRRLAEQEAGEWGDRVVEKLATDLRAAFPAMSGFSRTNLFYMRQVHLVWADAARSVQQLVGRLAWGHHLVLVAKVTDAAQREWKALTNFKTTLPKRDSDLAHETLKDPYVFDFLTLGPDAQERDLEQGLTDHVQQELKGNLPTIEELEAELAPRRPKPP